MNGSEHTPEVGYLPPVSHTMVAPTRFLNYPRGADLPVIVGPDEYGAYWRGVAREETEAGIRVGLLPIPPAELASLGLASLSVVRTVLRPDELAEARRLSALAAAEIAGGAA